jgi:hypothetical protein
MTEPNKPQPTVIPSDEPSPIRQKYYDRVYDTVTKARLSNSENYDRAILTIASATLGVSVHFLLGTTSHLHLEYLAYGWLTLGVAVLLNMAAYLVSNQAQAFALKEADHAYLGGKYPGPNRWGYYHGWASVLAGLALLVGMAFLALYFLLNIPNPKEPQKVKDVNDQSGQFDPARTISGPGGQEKSTAGAPLPQIVKLPSTEERGAPLPLVAPLPNQQPASAPTPGSSTTPPASPGTSPGKE